MEYRNPAFTADGRIDVEINHPVYGWIPFTADAADTGAAFDVASLDAEIRAAGVIAPYVPPQPNPLALAAFRYARETGGLTLPGGTVISTTERSQGLITGTVAGFQQGLLTGTVQWKADSGWIELTGAQVIALGGAVAQHIQRCFAAERVVTEALETDPTLDIAAAFDAAYATLEDV